MIRWSQFISLLAIFATAVALTGCREAKTADVSGTVIYDGSPVEEGSISFAPLDGQGPTGGGIIKDGKYTATKVPVGNTKVSITATKVVGKQKAYDTPDSPEIPVRKDVIPEKYNAKTELTFEVRPGTNEKSWELAK